jgi:hypothetical protein
LVFFSFLLVFNVTLDLVGSSDLEGVGALVKQVGVGVSASAAALAKSNLNLVESSVPRLVLRGLNLELELGVVSTRGELVKDLGIAYTVSTIRGRGNDSKGKLTNTGGVDNLVLSVQADGVTLLGNRRNELNGGESSGSSVDDGALAELHADPDGIRISVVDELLKHLNTLDLAQDTTDLRQDVAGQETANSTASVLDTDVEDNLCPPFVSRCVLTILPPHKERRSTLLLKRGDFASFSSKKKKKKEKKRKKRSDEKTKRRNAKQT